MLRAQGPDACLGWRRGRPTDIYALGACLFTFVYGRIPFSAPTVYQLFQVVQTEPLKFPEEPAVSDDLKDLLYQMLIKVILTCLLRTLSAAYTWPSCEFQGYSERKLASRSLGPMRSIRFADKTCHTNAAYMQRRLDAADRRLHVMPERPPLSAQGIAMLYSV